MGIFQSILRWSSWTLVAILPGCGSIGTTTKDLSSFDDFRMDSIFAPQPCACSNDCPVSTHIVRQDDGTYHVEFEDSSRDLTPGETEQLKELFRNVEFANTLLACLTQTALRPNCPTFFYWDSLDDSSSAGATNSPCAMGASPLSTQQAESILQFMEELEMGTLE